MSITKSYNKHTDTYYAYDTTYVWDEKLQKKVQKKVCIGKYDPKTGDIIPTARRGRPSKFEPGTVSTVNLVTDIVATSGVFERSIQEIDILATEIHEINSEIKQLAERMFILENRLCLLKKELSKGIN